MQANNKQIIYICLLLLLVFLTGFILDNTHFFEAMKFEVQNKTISADLMSGNKHGKILRKLDLFSVTPNEDFKKIEVDSSPDHRKRIVKNDNKMTKYLYSLNKDITYEEMPSSVLKEKDLSFQGAIISVVVNKNHLYEIHSNPMETGRKWEYPAYVSYFDNRELKFSTGVGIRLHGGLSRLFSPVKSYRLYFRYIYGDSQFMPGLIFEESSYPLRHLILHNDLRARKNEDRFWHFTNPIAYEIAREIGCITPSTKPVQFYLNGEFKGVYVLTEHLSKDYLISHYGHDNFVSIRLKNNMNEISRVKIGNINQYRELKTWIRSLPAPVEIEKVANNIDLENLTNWFISILFCGTTDPFQGLLLKDLTKENAKWFWINWDMDHSFMDLYKQVDEAWKLDTFSAVLDGRHLNSVILKRLLTESPEYRGFFKNKFSEALNNKLTNKFLTETIDKYEIISHYYGIENTFYIDQIRTFIDKRKKFLIELSDKYI